jgi:hypothetical protein
LPCRTGAKDPALAHLIDAWPSLPAGMRAGITAMIEATQAVGPTATPQAEQVAPPCGGPDGTDS